MKVDGPKHESGRSTKNETRRFSKVCGWSKSDESGRSSKVCGNKQRLKSDRLKMRERSKRDESGRSQNVRVAIK